jgi:hypothetical protein
MSWSWALFRQRVGKLAVIAWVASAVLAGVLVGLLASMGLIRAFVPVALGLTTTALGTLLPRHRRSTHSGPGARSASHSRFSASTKPSQPTNRSSVPSSMRRSPLTGSRSSSSWSWTVSSRFLPPVAASSIGTDGIRVHRFVASGGSPKSFPELSRRSSSGRGEPNIRRGETDQDFLVMMGVCVLSDPRPGAVAPSLAFLACPRRPER